MKFDQQRIGLAVYNIIVGLGLDLNDENLRETPNRVAKAFRELCRGLYEQDKIDEILSKTFPCDFDEMVVVTNIEATGVCPHHLMPVRYRIHVGYIPSPKGQVLGLSKIPRLVCLLAARPILQEQLTKDIADVFEDNLEPLGIMVVINGGHSCMQCRGVKMVDSQMITSAVRGIFRSEGPPKQEFLGLLGNFKV